MPDSRRHPLLRWFLHPYVQIALGVMLTTASELLLKRGASAAPHPVPWLSWLGVTALVSWWAWAGIATYVASFLSWLQVLRDLPLNVAFSLMSVVHATIPLGAWLLLGESVGPRRWGGVACVLLGVVLIAQQAGRAESRVGAST